jgi:Flp pilus assembly protein TadD/transglutaminase-like putative cysteine protease
VSLSLFPFIPFLYAAQGDTAGDGSHFSIDAKALYSSASETKPPDGTDVLVLDSEEMFVFDASGRSVHTEYLVYKVLTQRGADGWAEISREWEPWHEDHPSIRARVITPDFTAHDLDQKTITDASPKERDAEMYTDRKVVRAPLPAVAPGSVVEQEFVSKETAPLFSAGTVNRVYFGVVSTPVQHSRLVLEAPSSLPLRYAQQLLPDLKPSRTEAEGTVRIVFDQGPMAALAKPEPNLPSDVAVFPEVMFSTGSSWRQVAEDYAKAVDSHVGGADVKGLVNQLTQGKRTRNEKAQALLAYLDKEVRYTGIEFSETAIVPHSPAETLAHQYGDCKDKATLLVAMLRAADIPAYVALLNAGQRMDVPANLPGMGLFDHAIVYAPGKPDMWIDPTDDYARLGQIPASDQGRHALITRAGSDALVLTPESSSQENVLTELRQVYLADYGPARMVETSQPRGGFESEYRRYYADEQNKAVRENLTAYVKGQYLAEKLDRLDRSDPTDFSKPFEVVLESQKAKRGFTDLDTSIAAIRLEGLFGRLPGELQRREEPEENLSEEAKARKKRTADYQLAEAFTTEWQYTITPPLGFQPKPLPQDQKLSLGPAALTEKFSADSNATVHAVLRFDTVKRRFTVAEATEMRNRIAELREGTAISINFELTAQALLSQGKVRESFKTYRTLIAQRPNEAVHHLQIAKALLEAGMGEGARAEARLAAKLEPTSALAEKTLAEILEFDLVGRKFRPGSDYIGAAEAFRAAASLDPDDKEITANLAILLEFNADGARYGPGARLTEAIAEYRDLPKEKLEKFGMQNNLVVALFYAGEFAEARKLAELLNPQPQAIIVACDAALHGSQSAITEANKLAGGEAEVKQIEKAAGESLMNLRKYELAADLLEAGASGDTAARTMGLAASLRKAKLHEELRFGNDPVEVATGFFLQTIDANVTQEKESAFLSKNALTVMKYSDPEEVENTLKVGKQVRRKLARSGILPDVMIDILVESLEPKSDGNDASGYRVVLHTFGGSKVTMFIVKEDGKYKVLDTADNPNSIGLEVLDRVAAGDLTSARTLLDWVREEQHLAGGDDPLAGGPFPRFWTKGRNADASQIKLAAAAMLVQTKPTAKQGLPILEEARRSANSDSDKTNLDLALLAGYGNAEDYEKLLSVSTGLAKEYPESKQVFNSECFALRAVGRFDEANDLAQQRLKRLPDDVDAMQALVRNAIAREDYRASHDLTQKIINAGKGDASDLNGLAWQTLFYSRAGGPDIESAIKATEMSQNNPHILHTLGCTYAEAGRTKEAREVLIQAMDLQDLDEPNPDYWYGLGRIAEQYGELEFAKADYDKVTKPKNALLIPDSSYRLAQNRLQVIRSGTQPNVVAAAK